MLRRHHRIFLYGTLLGELLRAWFIVRFPRVAGDSLVYGDIARNWLHHGVFGLTENGVPVPTYIRLPGYPAFLAANFAVFGDHFMPVLIAQMLIDLCGCFVIAGLAEGLLEGSGAFAFVLAALCPFTANYVALPLTETLEIFFTALAMLLIVRGTKKLSVGPLALKLWIFAGVAIGACILLRPDGGILLAAFGTYLVVRMLRGREFLRPLASGVLVGVIALGMLVPWTFRNWRVFHEFRPLAPRYANAPGEFVPAGFNRWVKTWILDYVSVEDIYWRVPTESPEEAARFESLPARACDNAGECLLTRSLLQRTAEQTDITPDIDAEFARLAQARIAHHPLRHYVLLPAGRIADMWLRPRTEMLPLDQRWWRFDDPPESAIAILMGAINLALLALAAYGAWVCRRSPAAVFLLIFVVLRSLFLGTLENPEPRYTLECFPAALAWAGVAIGSLVTGSRPAPA